VNEEGREVEEEEEEGRKKGGGEERESECTLLHDAIVYIDSVTVRELFVFTVERPSQQAITTIPFPPPRIVSPA